MPAVKARLLLVDDNAEVRDLLAERLSTMGHKVRSAVDGFSALQEIRREVPEILISDLNMPRMSGFEFLSVVRRRFPSIRVVAMSGEFAGDDLPDGIAADAFYEKGSPFGKLLLTIEALSESDLLDLDEKRERVPIWIEWNGSHDPKGTEVMMTCPECLRNFPQVIRPGSGPMAETECVHCRSTIHYAIVPNTPM
jgi:CheY-like chemotaxis protein